MRFAPLLRLRFENRPRDGAFNAEEAQFLPYAPIAQMGPPPSRLFGTWQVQGTHGPADRIAPAEPSPARTEPGRGGPGGPHTSSWRRLGRRRRQLRLQHAQQLGR